MYKSWFSTYLLHTQWHTSMCAWDWVFLSCLIQDIKMITYFPSKQTRLPFKQQILCHSVHYIKLFVKQTLMIFLILLLNKIV